MKAAMKWFRDLSIRHKLVILFVALGCLTAFAVSAPMGIYDYVSYKRAMVRDLATLADVLAQNSSAALTFHDAETANDVLRALRAEPDVTRACIYDASGQIFAMYVRDANASLQLPAPPKSPTVRFEGGRLFEFRKIELAGDTVGTLYRI